MVSGRTAARNNQARTPETGLRSTATGETPGTQALLPYRLGATRWNHNHRRLGLPAAPGYNIVVGVEHLRELPRCNRSVGEFTVPPIAAPMSRIEATEHHSNDLYDESDGWSHPISRRQASEILKALRLSPFQPQSARPRAA